MSYRNDTDATYDRALLSSVPDPTRAEKQEGYNVDLLDEGRDRRAPSPPVPNRQATDQQPLTDAAAVAHPYKEGRMENGDQPAVTKGPWYRTRWGITAIVIAIILIIGGIVGGAVGGTRHSSPKLISGGGSGNHSSTSGGGAGPSPSNSTSTSTGNQGGFNITGTSTTTPSPSSGTVTTSTSFDTVTSGSNVAPFNPRTTAGGAPLSQATTPGNPQASIIPTSQ